MSDQPQASYKQFCHECDCEISVVYPYCPWCRAGQQSEEAITRMEDELSEDTKKKNIIQNILGHSKGAPSLAEIEYYNPSMSEGEIKDYLVDLIGTGVVIRLTLPEGEQEGDTPDAFFALTEDAWQVFNHRDIFVDQIDEIRHDHARVEKTAEIKRYESAPRPDFPREAYSPQINP